MRKKYINAIFFKYAELLGETWYFNVYNTNIQAYFDDDIYFIELNWMFIVKDELIIKTQNWTKIKLPIKQQFEHQIIAEKLKANRNLLRLNTNHIIMLGGTNDKKSIIDAILPLSLIELK